MKRISIKSIHVIDNILDFEVISTLDPQSWTELISNTRKGTYWWPKNKWNRARIRRPHSERLKRRRMKRWPRKGPSSLRQPEKRRSTIRTASHYAMLSFKAAIIKSTYAIITAEQEEEEARRTEPKREGEQNFAKAISITETL